MQVLLAWSPTKVLVSFRGTASLANAIADIQVSSLFCMLYLPRHALLSDHTLLNTLLQEHCCSTHCSSPLAVTFLHRALPLPSLYLNPMAEEHTAPAFDLASIKVLHCPQAAQAWNQPDPKSELSHQPVRMPPVTCCRCGHWA